MRRPHCCARAIWRVSGAASSEMFHRVPSCFVLFRPVSSIGLVNRTNDKINKLTAPLLAGPAASLAPPTAARERPHLCARLLCALAGFMPICSPGRAPIRNRRPGIRLRLRRPVEADSILAKTAGGGANEPTTRSAPRKQAANERTTCQTAAAGRRRPTSCRRRKSSVKTSRPAGTRNGARSTCRRRGPGEKLSRRPTRADTRKRRPPLARPGATMRAGPLRASRRDTSSNRSSPPPPPAGPSKAIGAEGEIC